MRKGPLWLGKERNLADYNSESRKLQFPDLNQYAKNGRGRGETVDNALPTLTTTSGRLFSQACDRRFKFDVRKQSIPLAQPTQEPQLFCDPRPARHITVSYTQMRCWPATRCLSQRTRERHAGLQLLSWIKFHILPKSTWPEMPSTYQQLVV